MIQTPSSGVLQDTVLKFFEELTDEQRKNIQSVSGDGAKWIDACIEKYIPHAKRCVDAFHVVTWATEGLDELRKEAWRDAYIDFKTKEKSSTVREVNLKRLIQLKLSLMKLNAMLQKLKPQLTLLVKHLRALQKIKQQSLK